MYRYVLHSEEGGTEEQVWEIGQQAGVLIKAAIRLPVRLSVYLPHASTSPATVHFTGCGYFIYY